MRISKIELKDFRGFPAPEVFDLEGGKNLLLYGENGSGKSSLYRALVEFLNLDPKAQPFHKHRNIFSAGPDKSWVDGHVSLELEDGSRHEWHCLGARPHGDKALPPTTRERWVDTARRASLLEYRSLLQTNFNVTDVREKLFELTVTTLLANVPIVGTGGRVRTISQLWVELVESKPKQRTHKQLSRVAAAEKAFNEGLRGILPDVRRIATEILSYFTGTGLELRLDLPGVRYDGSPYYTRDCKFKDKVLDFEVKLNSVSIPDWNTFLNEARLSALAMSLYLTGAILGNPRPPASVSTPLKLLVLDDVLIGLDMAHRLPVLDLINKEFVKKEWQVLLFTFDRAWYEIAKQQLGGGKWKHYELYAVRVADYEQPLLKEDRLHLDRAVSFLADGEVKAAAVHVRTKFELVLKEACHKLGVPVKYNLEAHKMQSSDFWSALKGHKVDRYLFPKPVLNRKTGAFIKWLPQEKVKHRVVPEDLERRVEHAISWVLNPLSHSQTVDRYRGEIEAAIFVIDELEQAIRHAISPQKPDPKTLITQVLFAVLAGRVSKLASDIT